MSIGTLLGVILGFGLLFGAIFIGANDVHVFLNLESFLIVIGGTLANAYMSYQASHVKSAIKAIGQMFGKAKASHETLDHELKHLTRWAALIQSKGMLWFEQEMLPNIREPFLRYGIELVISNYKIEEIRIMLNTAVEGSFERNMVPVTVLRNMAASAPAFGMVATLVGMVIMMANLQSDMTQIGHGLALALTATLYGIVTARLVCLPAAEKLQQKEEIMRFRNYLITEGFVLLAGKHNPQFIQDKLFSFLDPAVVKQGLRNKPVVAATTEGKAI